MFRHELGSERPTEAPRAMARFLSSLALAGALAGCGEQADEPVEPELEVVCDYEEGGNHVVKEGEFLSTIARDYVESNGIDVHYTLVSEDIAAENGVGNVLVIGKTLTLPSECEQISTTPRN